MMERKPESDFPVEQEEPFQETAEPWLELLLEVAELTSQFAKPETHTTDGRQREEEHGQELEVLLWTQSTILMVVVINNTSVTLQLSADMHHTVKRSVLLLPEEQVLLEVARKKPSKLRNDEKCFP